MTTYTFDPSELKALKGKTIILTGCSSGIGRETAKIAYENGANLALGDWNESLAETLINELGSKDRVVFRRTDVSSWDDILELFQLAWKTFGIIHAVLSNAGSNVEDLLTDHIDPDSGKLMAPSLGSIEINLHSHLYVVKCAVHYFAKWPETRCQIVMTGSAASFLDTPPVWQYCAAKAGVLGLMRACRTQLIKKNITINMIAPWMTLTPMVGKYITDRWSGLPENQPWGIAHAILLPVVRPDVNGKAFFVAGHQIVDLEDTLHETQPLWMGEQLSKDVDEGQRRLTA